MNLTVKEITTLTDGRTNGIYEIAITGAAGLDEAGPTDISFIANPKYASKVANSKAGLIFITDEFKTNKPAIIVKNPQLAFAKVLTVLAEDILPDYKPLIHQQACVSKSAKIAPGVHIGPFVVIEDNVQVGEDTVIVANTFIGSNTKIGANSLIYPNVTIRENIIIGQRAIIHPGVVIGGDGFGFVGAKKHFKIPQIGTVEIGDDVEIGSNCAIDRATIGKTKIGSGTKIDNMVHFAHNVIVGENCIICGQSGIAGSAKIGDYVTMAAQSGITGHVSVGDNTIVAARAAVIGDVRPNQIVSGFPARPHREAMKVEALIRKLPDLFEKIKILTQKVNK